ncbi:MAG: hypothetical protein AB7P23_04310 [Amphiplicatus sp.]
MNAARFIAGLVFAGGSLAGCAGLARLAPPGVIKYEDLAGGEPTDPVMKAHIEARRAESREAFPDISATPSEKPPALSLAQRDEAAAGLREARDALAAAIAEDRAEASFERETGVKLPGDDEAAARRLEEAQEALADAVARDEAAARRERGLPPRQTDKKDKNEP